MEFVNPGFLYGLLAISIPVIIHLFNFRRFKKVYFTNVSFIKELKLQTQKQSRLKHLLILIMRILAIAAIVLAFAQPYIPVSENLIKPHEKNAVSIYIDNSFSMQSESEKGILLDEAKEKAIEIAEVYKASDLFQLLTNDFEGKHQRFVSKDEFENLVEEVSISPVVKSIPDVIKRQLELFNDNPALQKTAYEISDFQKGVFKDEVTIEDSSVNIFYIPLKALNADNIYIDSCWFVAPVQQLNQNVELKVIINNSSANTFEKIPVKLKINGQQKALGSIDIEPNSSAEITLAYTNNQTGIQYGEIEITDYPVIFDDKFYFSYNVSPVTNVLCINGNPSIQNLQGESIYINSLFRNDSSFIFRNVKEGNIDYSSLETYQLIILNELKEISSGLSQETKKFVDRGGRLMVIPSENIDLESYRSFSKVLNIGIYETLDTNRTKVSYINLEHPLYSDVFDEIPENIDLPVVFKKYPVKVATKSRQESLLELQTGDVFLNIFNIESGKVYMFSVPFQTSFSNFPKHAIFVPTLFKIAVSSVFVDNLYYSIGENEVINVRYHSLSGDNVFKINGRSSEFEFIPEHRKVNSHIDIFTHGQISQAENYTLFDGNEAIKGIAFNYDRTESEMRFYTIDEMKEILANYGGNNIQILESENKPFVQTLTEFSQGIKLWRWFVMFALLFLLTEVLLLRFWK